MAWFGNAWLYRQPIVISNTANATSALSYYQAGISLTGAAYTSFRAHAKADGSDTRVTDSDGVTLLSFALEGIDTTNSVIYLLVKVPAVGAGATRTIYVYYGNASATSVSSYATTVGSTTALTGPTDVYTQTDTANFNQTETLLLLQHQDGVNGGGGGLNGQLLAFNMIGGNSNADRTNSGIGTMISTDGGTTWGSKTIILAHDATRCCEPRSTCELADGTILMIYSADLPANANAGKAKMGVAKLVGGPGGTWSNLALAPSSLLTVPWTYGTDLGTAYHKIFADPSGNLYAPAYGKITADTGYHSWLLTCPAASDPTIGTNWTVKGTIAFDNVGGYSETAVAVLGGGGLVAVMRNDIYATTGPDLFTCSSTDWGATWTAPVRMNVPAAVTNSAVSPDILALASGNYLLTWGIRYGTDWGIGAVLSTDKCVTWFDRAPAFFVCNTGQTTGDGGYPNCVQNAGGTICCLYYREVGGNVATVNIVRTLSTEDWIANSPNVYDGCEALTGFSVGANATVSTTHVHNGTNAIKIDNSVGTGGAGDWALKNCWSVNAALRGPKGAFSYWAYETANDSGRAAIVKDSTGVFNNATGNRSRVTVVGTTSDHIEWYNGTAFQDTGTAAPANQWHKITDKAAYLASSATGEILLNNTSLTTSQGQEGSGGNPQMVLFQGGSVASTHNVIFWVDDLYTHQYTANTPTMTAGTEQINLGSAGIMLGL